MSLACLVGLGHFYPVGAGETEWRSGDGYRWADLQVRQTGRAGFAFLPSDRTGITFTNSLDEAAAAANRVLLNGSGVAAGDFDNDGRVDLYFCGLNHSNVLYKNLGDWKFRDVTVEAGIQSTNRFCRGAVFADIDGDGWVDLLVSTVGNGVQCFMNNRDGTFSDRTQTAGTISKFGSMTMSLADIDGNGTLDLYVGNNRAEDIRDRGRVDLQLVKGQVVVPPALKDRLMVVNGQVLEYGEPDQLFLNDGRGHFTAASWIDGRFVDEEGSPLKRPLFDWALTVAFRDLNGDGAPDLYVCNDYWTPDRIWLNDGRGNFRAIDKLALRCTSGSSMGVDFADLDRDGYLDFLVVDMRSRDSRLRRRQLPAQPPVGSPIGAVENRPQVLRNTLFRNRGDGTYEEIANLAGLAASDWSWQPVFLDVDLDGFEDVLVTTGHARDVQDMDAERQIRALQHSWKGFTNAVERQNAFTLEMMSHMRLYPRLDTPILAFRNSGRLTFSDATETWGTGQRGVHHGIALADLDNDGDLDVVVNNLGSAAGIYRNETGAPRVAVRLHGLAPNTRGIGAKIWAYGGAIPVQSQEMVCGGRYLSCDDPMRVFGGGGLTNEMRIEVQWRSGKRSVVGAVKANRIYEIDEAGAETSSKPKGQRSREGPTSNIQHPTSNNQRPTTNNQQPTTNIEQPRTQNPEPRANGQLPLFEDQSGLLKHVHHEEAFDDFARQGLLPRRLSQLGPGVAWFDVDGDGWEDLIIGTGKGGELTLFINDRKGGFIANKKAPLPVPVTRDQTAVLGWRRASRQAVLLAGSANYEDGLFTGPAARQYDLAEGRMDESLPSNESSSGPLAMADMDGDGQLDLFIGGRTVPGRYPEAASSLLLHYAKGQWSVDAENSRILHRIGLVSGAVWSDLDGDGFPELILACEWGPIRIFKNERGNLVPWDAPVTLNSQLSTLNQLTGWWNSVTTGDLDGDGKPDIIAGNWGLNSDYGQPTTARSVRLYFGDFRGAGAVDIVEAEYDEALKAFAPRRRLDVLSRQLPSLQEAFPTHRAFSEAPIETVLRPWQSGVHYLEATTLATMVFFNRTNRFEARELPLEAQVAPVFAVNVADFDGDGHEDVFLSQNFFATEPETPRLDAGRGLLLLNDGHGNLHALPGPQSGIMIYGEQRGAAVADFDHDGRPDLVVTQNGGPTRLVRNVGGRPGLRVRLVGPPGNPDAVGASLRLFFPDHQGPAREIHAGSGYWSQDGASPVLGTPEQPSELWVRWPGGRTTTTSVPASLREITVEAGREQ